MADTTHWIVVRPGEDPYEVDTAYVVDNWTRIGQATFLVPGRVWRDYRKRSTEMAAARAELMSFNRAELTVHAPSRGRELRARNAQDDSSGDASRVLGGSPS